MQHPMVKNGGGDTEGQLPLAVQECDLNVCE